MNTEPASLDLRALAPSLIIQKMFGTHWLYHAGRCVTDEAVEDSAIDLRRQCNWQQSRNVQCVLWLRSCSLMGCGVMSGFDVS